MNNSTFSEVEFDENFDDDFTVDNSMFSELNTEIEYDDVTGEINYTGQFDAIIICLVFILFAVSTVAGVILGGIFFKR